MKSYVFSLLIIGLLLSASFGLVMMNHMDGQGHSVCPFETVGVTDCAQVQSPISSATSHLNAASKFFSAIPINGLAGLIALFVLLALALVSLNKDFKLFKLKSAFTKNHLREPFILAGRSSFTSWFALHENSPSFS